jgi:GxxExxY protein
MGLNLNEVNEPEFLYKKETHEIIGICMEVHRTLGHGFLEIVYKDAIEVEFKWKKIVYEREAEHRIDYKGVILPRGFVSDFFVFEKVILEIKSSQGDLSDLNIAQTLNYLKASGCKVGLLINFGKKSLEFKRFVF